MDYFNQYTFATQTAGMIGELEYTKKLTAISTLISTPLIVLGSYLTQVAKQKLIEICAKSGNKIAMSILSKTVSAQVQKMTLQQTIGLLATQMAVRTAIGTYSEILQEVVVDGVIETYIGNIVKSWGWSSEVGYWLSTLATSARESKFFGLLTRNIGIDTSQQSLSYGAQIYLAQKTNRDFKSWYSALLTQEDNNAFSEAQIALTNQEAITSKISELNIFSNEQKVPTIKKLSALFIASGLMLFLPGLSSIGSAIGIEYFSTTFLDNLDRRLMHSYQSHLYNRMSNKNSILTQQKQNTAPDTKTLINRDIEGLETLPTINVMPQINDIHKIDVVDNVNQKTGFANILKNLIDRTKNSLKVPTVITEAITKMKNKIKNTESSQISLNILENEQSIDNDLSQTTERFALPIVKSSEGVEAVDPLFKYEDHSVGWTFFTKDGKLTVKKAFNEIKRNFEISKGQSIYLRFFKEITVSIDSNEILITYDSGDVQKYSMNMEFNDLLDILGYNSLIEQLDDNDWISDDLMQMRSHQIEILDYNPNGVTPIGNFLGISSLSPEVLKFYTEQFGYWFKNRVDVLITQENAPIYEQLYQMIQDLTRSMTLSIQGLKYDNSIVDMSEDDVLTFIDQIENLMKSYWNSYFADAKTLNSFKNEDIKNAYLKFIESLYINIFNKGFDDARNELANGEFRKKDFMSVVVDRIQFTILDSIMRECEIDNPSMNSEDINQRLSEFLGDDNRIDKLYYDFHSGKGITKFINIFTECFLVDPLISNKISLNNKIRGYQGYIGESKYFLSMLKGKVIGWFNELVERLTPEQLNYIKIYNRIKYSPNDNEINTFNLNYDDIEFYIRSAVRNIGRFFDGGGIFDFITLIISTHIKNTWFKSIIEADRMTPNSYIVESLCDDGLSAMIVDIIKRISTSQSIQDLPQRLVQLIAPFIVQDMDETSKNIIKILDTFYSKNIYNIGNKLPDHEIFLVAFMDLINEELAKREINTKEVLRDEIINILKNPKLKNSEFRKKTIDLAYDIFKSDHFANQLKNGVGFIQLADLIINQDNFENLIATTSSGRLQLNFIFNYNPHFRVENNQKISISDFPSQYKIYTLDKSFKDDMYEINTDDDLISLAQLGGLVICHHEDYLEDRIILVPVNRISELSNTRIREGFKDNKGNIYHDIFVADNKGVRLISKLEFSQTILAIRKDKNNNVDQNWAKEFYIHEEIRDDTNNLIGYKSNFYAGYLISSGEDIQMSLQETILNVEHIEPYRSPLPNILVRDSQFSLIKKEEYKVQNFIDIENIDDDNVKKELVEILSVIEQFTSIFLPSESKKYNIQSISELIISEDFYDQDLEVIKNILKDFHPSEEDQELTTLSNHKINQKEFFSTLHKLINKYTGTNSLLLQYKKKYNSVQFSDLESNKYTQEEYRLVEVMDDLLRNIFGYRFYTLLKIGMIHLSMEDRQIKIQPIVFNYDLLRDILYKRGVRSINSRSSDSIDSYKTQDFLENVFIPLLLFGHLTIIDIGTSKNELMRTKASNDFLNNIIDGNFQEPEHYRHYGALKENFIACYLNKNLSPDYSEKKMITGKSSIMNDFSTLLKTLMSPKLTRSAGRILDINIFKYSPSADIWSQKNINFAVSQLFQWVVTPGIPNRNQDPISSLARIFTGTQEVQTIQYISNNIEGPTEIYWDIRNYGTLTLNSQTFETFFRDNIYKIQPALYYNYYNIKKNHLTFSINSLLTKEFAYKISHLYSRLSTILSNNYENGQKFTAEFHIENNLGFGEFSKINSDDNKYMTAKFGDLIDNYQLEFNLEKDGSKILNEAKFRQFVASIVFYMVMFNAQVFIKEGARDEVASYGVFASQRELFSEDYVIGLGEERINAKLSDKGRQILGEWKKGWNKIGGKDIWNYGDCWPIWMFDDAINLKSWFNNFFNMPQKDGIIELKKEKQ
ncbi:MAG: hypothetical protein JXA99_14195 [Candidatus Lokiarchaeota archaeon]|nr:hypothetical protein [Candidatus Lokiarchaeota archaeon]